MDEPIYFNSKTHQWAWLSNFAPTPIVDKKNAIWPTAEHAYQGQKTHDTKWKRTIRGATTPATAKRWGKQVPVRSDWDKVKVKIMRNILAAKFGQSDELHTKLIQTDGRELIHLSPWDGFWGTGPSKNGKNMLGKLLMELRSAYQKEREEECKQEEPVQKE